MLSLQRRIDTFADEPLTAILPSAALLDVWQLTGAAETSLFAISGLVVVVGLASMLIALLRACANAAARWRCCARSARGRGTCSR